MKEEIRPGGGGWVGVRWCGVERVEGNKRLKRREGVKKIALHVEEVDVKRIERLSSLRLVIFVSLQLGFLYGNMKC